MDDSGISYEEAIITELRERIDAAGGLNVFVREHPDLDKRNVGKHITKQLPTLPALLKYLSYLGVTWEEFFAASARRQEASKPDDM
jgi:hypothetical protein